MNIHGFQFESKTLLFIRQFWLQTLVVIDSKSCQTSFPSFCAQSSEVAVLFYWNMSRRPYLWQVVDLELLHCTRFASKLSYLFLFFCRIFTQRPTNDCMMSCIERYFGLWQNFAKSIKIPFPMTKIRHHSSVFVLAQPASLVYAGPQEPHEPCHWFCSQNLLLSSGIAF